ncbi:penicillin-binding protein 2 [Pseudoleptotrichia goodfellowii]|uniref:Penicillin-binding protein 2 n=1 Tax=Pseudoleptotrichia goodfellowii TaxID=157692 RepID=A0A510J7V9_9FUSO|nr:penicillin-binding protein 2 [Pseudoleptotrichia goodfellowii]MBF4805298.1 penicillin-binding protein 2 [Pseudoleptotrichia goodfellowii]BBM35380.1 penicillin-binding protein 2 [Pseudoleptotrichia goodfellowii]
MRELDKEERNPRYVMFILLVASVFTVLVARLFSLQILNASTYEERALQNRIRTNVIKATRGEIYDREGKLLAKNTTGYKLIHTDTRQLSSNDIELLRKIQNLDENQLEEALSRQKKQKAEGLKETIEDIRTISQITGYTTDYIITRFSKQPRIGIDKTILVIEDLDKNIALKAVEKIKNNRINIVEYNKRYYPEDSIASHVIGNVKPISEKEYNELKKEGYQNDDLIGKKGVEKEYDKEMKGQDGVEDVEVDVHGNVIKEIKNVSSITGKNIYLSIDLDLQKYMTQAFAGKSGAFIAMEVKTGKIITFVSYPEISLNLLSSRIPDDQWNELVNSKAKPLVNKGIAGLYPPGSTFKAITGLGILESGISPYDTVMSTGQYKFGKLIFRDSSSRGYGITNFNKSIEHSVNTYYYVFSQRAGKDNIIKYAKEMGVGEKTGIDIPGEQAGVLPTPEWKKKRFKKKQDQIWLPGDLINMSIGQGYVLMTPVQVLSAYQIIANNGVMIKPTVVDRFVSYDGKVEKNEPKILRKIKVSDKNLKLMQNALRLPVSSYGGTARVLYFPNFPVSAKTGTAQNTGFRDNHSWIAGYFPSDNPQIVFVSIIEGAGYGGVASGQLARTFIEKYRDKYEFKKNILPEQQNQVAENTGKKKKRKRG